jgi:transcriptional regulator with XRE-family HTH domain
MDLETKKTLADNVKRLMDHHQLTQTSLAKKAGVSQRNVSNLIKAESPHSPTLKTVEDIAKVFKLQTWHLLLPGAPIDLLINTCIEKVVFNYATASKEGRDMINRVSDREAAIASQGQVDKRALG